MSAFFGEKGRTIATFIIAGVVLSAVIAIIAYVVALIVKLSASSFSEMHRAGLNATGVNATESVAVQVGNETLLLDSPRNPALRDISSPLFSLLSVIASILTHPVTLAVLIALTLVAYALMEK
jgi:predicted PurR-regulated permease PerM